MFEHFFENETKEQLTGLTNEMQAIFASQKQKEKPVVFVTNSLYEANVFYNALKNYSSSVYLFPMDDFLTSEALAISPDLKYTRLETLNAILKENRPLVVTNLMGFLRYLPTRSLYENKIITLEENQEISMKSFITKLIDLGYSRESLVNKTGEFAVRGFVLDIFPVSEEFPIRIEFWGDTIDQIKEFDVDTQRTKKELKKIILMPNTEFLAESEVPHEKQKQKYLNKFTKVVNISSYLENPYIIFHNFHDISVGYEHLCEEIVNYNESNNVKDTYMFSLEDCIKKNSIYLNQFDDQIKQVGKIYHSKELSALPKDKKEMNHQLNQYLKEKKTIVLCLQNRYHVNKLLDYLENPNVIFTNEFDLYPDKINVIVKNITFGFAYDSLVVYGEREIFHQKEETLYKTRFRYGKKIRDISKLEVGDYVVHSMHGIGKYLGIRTLKKNNLEKDYLMIEYKDHDKLYIPVEKIEFLSKYSSNDAVVPNLSKLGGTEWQKTKLRVKKKIEDIASDLMKLYAEREQTQGFAFLEDTKEQYEFEKEFPYPLTEDQEKVIKEIKKDMEKPVPMDRLLCGDVGYGKTEVAFRAVFKAIMSGKQALILCPTTILSSQHYQNAIKRFENYPVKIALLNRFVTGARLKKILEEISSGYVDFVIGTHKALGKEIQFHDLGLLVIDEEQRFGVKHKEKIKQYKNNIDVLTLSATPIPRTLQMSMAGLRSLSLIETPPMDRYPVQTYVLAENKQIIKDAIYKELSRNGQIFFLYNHVDSIEQKVEEIQKLVPEARIFYAHGKMTKEQLEDVMYRFMEKEADILVCTTIIETGIDIASANTLLIMDADRFGLSQLYQIRGRVGRSNKIAYCYLMYDPRKILTEVAVKRLKVIKEFTELGSGFSIAMRDLSIRGAGDILGKEQSGFVDSVGVELFLQMLNEEVNKMHGKKKETSKKETALIDVQTTISDDYVADEDIKIEIHKKINQINSKEKLKEIQKELEDRFGKINEDINIYMHEELFENMAAQLNITNIKQTKTFIEMELPKDLLDQLDGQTLFLKITQLSRKIRFQTKFNHYYLILDFVNLDRHFIYYLIDLMDIIKECIKKD